MFSKWILFFISVATSVLLALLPGIHRSFSAASAALSVWYLYCALERSSSQPRSPEILRLGGFAWGLHDFCRGWLITGQTGSGKTVAAINTMLWQVTVNCPTWGGVCVDDKGLYWETLSSMFKHLGRAEDLILLQVRPENAAADWKPSHCFNFLDDPHLPYSAKAKIICDVAGSLGQRTENGFFRMQAQVQMEFAFSALRCAGYPVTLENAYEFLTTGTLLTDVTNSLAKQNTKEASELLDHYHNRFLNQPAEQLGGVKSTIANYLKSFTDPHIAEVFCPRKSTFSFDDIGKGKVICISLPQRYAVERRYLNTLLKFSFYNYALRRFDKPSAERAMDNLIILWADEAQKIVTAAADGMSDYNVVDVLREARATVVAATQSYTSLIPPMGDERKAKVFIANMANRITFCAADEDSAKIAADTLGKRKAKRRTHGSSGGKRTTSWTEEDRYFIEPHELRKLKKFEAVVQHCEKGFRRVKLPPLGTDGRKSSWYSR